MSNSPKDVAPCDTTEIEIKLDTVNNDSNSADIAENECVQKPSDTNSKPKSTSYQTIEPKHIANLTDDERATIIASVRNGVEQPYYDVKFYKNGNTRIIKRKIKKASTAEQIINSQPLPSATEAKRYYTDNQLLFEHIIELNSRIDKLTAKHKKLKNKYNTIRNDLYADDEDIEQSPLTKIDNDDTSPETSSNDTSNSTTNNDSLKDVAQHDIHESTHEDSSSHQSQMIYGGMSPQWSPPRLNWRSRVKYL